jgi:prevent-host-death family protein
MQREASRVAHIVNMHEAKTHLSRLVERAMTGEDIVIARAGEPAVRLVPCDPPAPRVPGGAKHLFTIREDFDDPLPPDLLKYFEWNP